MKTLSHNILVCLCLSLFFVGQVAAFQNPFSSKKEPEKLDSVMDDWTTRLEYARLLSYMQKYDQSLNEYDKLLKLNPNSKEARFEMARVLYYQKKYKPALELLNAMPAGGDDKPSQEEINLLTADIYLALKQYTPAEQTLRERAKSHPNDLISKYKLAQVLSWQKKYKEALPFFEEILQQRPGDIQLRRQYGMILMWMGNFEAAAQQLESTLPENGPSWKDP